MLDRFGGVPSVRFWLLAVALVALGAGALLYGRWYSENGYRQLAPADAATLASITARLDAWDDDQATALELRPAMEDLLARYPETPPVLVEGARLDLVRSNFGGEDPNPLTLRSMAQTKLRTALLIAPRDLRANVLMSHVETLLDDYRSAYERLALADDLVAEDGWRDVNWARLLALQGHEDEAIARYIRAIYGGAATPHAMAAAICRLSEMSDGPRQAEKREPIAIAMDKQGRSGAEMVAVARAVAHTGCANLSALLKAQDLLSWSDRFDAPLAERHVGYAEIFMRLDGTLSTGAGDHLHDDLSDTYAKLALDHADKALVADPNHGEALAIKAGILFDRREHEGAQAVVDYADAHGIHHWLLQYQRGRLLQQAGKHREAADVYAEVYAKGTHGFAAHYAVNQRRWALLAADDLDAAEQAFVERTSQYPYSDRAYSEALRFLIQYRGDAERAFAYGRENFDSLDARYGHPVWGAVLYVRWAQLVHDGGQPELAAEFHSMARSMYPDPAGLFRFMGPNRALVERALGTPVPDPKALQQRT